MSLYAFTEKSVRAVEGSCSLVEAAQQMIEHSVGALVIQGPGQQGLAGIITDRDLVMMLAEGLDPNTATVGSLVKAPLATIEVHASLSEAAELMHKHGVRRLPILDREGALIGLVSLDDVIATLSGELAAAAGAISEEISHERSITEPPRSRA